MCQHVNNRKPAVNERATLSAALFPISTGTVSLTTPEVIVHIAFAVSGEAEQGHGSSSSSLIIRSVARIRGKTKERIGITLLV